MSNPNEDTATKRPSAADERAKQQRSVYLDAQKYYGKMTLGELRGLMREAGVGATMCRRLSRSQCIRHLSRLHIDPDSRPVFQYEVG